MPPRPYQIQAHEAVRECWKTNPGAMIVLPTGTGKTYTALSLAVSDFLDHGKRVVWLAHRQELLDQPAREMSKSWPHHRAGIVQAERHSPDAPIVFASVMTLARSPERADEILAHGAPSLLVVDEAHHASSPSHRAAIEALGAPLRLGLTATPHREDGEDLSGDWEIAHSYDMWSAIQDGWLLRPYAVVDRVPDLNLEEISGRWDYDDAELGAELIKAGIVDHTVKAMGRSHTFEPLPREVGGEAIEGTARGRSCLVFTATIEQARLTAEALCEDGWIARHISGETPKRDRKRLIRAFADGKIEVLCNAAVLTEGTDLPIASVVVLARPTRSWSLFVQMLGRGLRLHESASEALVIDLAGATKDHSLISAPVLIGGSRCKKSPNQEHQYQEQEDGSAKCFHCGSRLSCFAHMGPHQWADMGHGPHCSGCGRPQCQESATKAHMWLAKAGLKKQCLCCGAEVFDPLAGMLSERRKRPEDAVEGDWVRLRGVSPNLAAVDVGEHGILFVRWADEEEGFEPLWLPKRCRKIRELVDRPIPREMVRAIADDLVQRAAKVAGVDAKWKERLPHRGQKLMGERWGVEWKGETAGEYMRRVLRVRARDRALAVGIVERA